MCSYYMVICTPLLCHALAEGCEGGPQMGFSYTKRECRKYGTATARSLSVAVSIVKKKAPIPSSKSNRKRKGTEPIRDTIEWTMDSVYLRSTSTNEVWAYEFCHGHHVRRCHKGKKFDSKASVMTSEMGQFTCLVNTARIDFRALSDKIRSS